MSGMGWIERWKEMLRQVGRGEDPETLDWDKTAPGPELPSEVIQKTAEKYQEALRRLTKV